MYVEIEWSEPTLPTLAALDVSFTDMGMGLIAHETELDHCMKLSHTESLSSIICKSELYSSHEMDKSMSLFGKFYSLQFFHKLSWVCGFCSFDFF